MSTIRSWLKRFTIQISLFPHNKKAGINQLFNYIFQGINGCKSNDIDITRHPRMLFLSGMTRYANIYGMIN